MKALIILLLGLLIVESIGGKFKKKLFLDFHSIIEHVNSVQKNWVAGHNRYFDGMDLERIEGLMGALETPPHLKLPVKDFEALENIPQEFSSAEKWPRCESIMQIRDQSNCGSCWAFGAVEIISDRICIFSGQNNQTKISAADMLACCGLCGYGCKGGYSDSAMNYWYKKGLVTGWLYNTTGWCYPYQFAPCAHHQSGRYEPCEPIRGTPACQQKCITGYNSTYKEDRHLAKDVYTIPSQVSKYQTEIMTNGPIQVTFTVYQDFLTYKSGIYEHTSGKKTGNHAVKMVGWGVENKIPYWLIANSWNQDWGDKGFFKIRRGNNECGIEGNAVAGIPKF